MSPAKTIGAYARVYAIWRLLSLYTTIRAISVSDEHVYLHFLAIAINKILFMLFVSTIDSCDSGIILSLYK
jgi:hypothetical protein